MNIKFSLIFVYYNTPEEIRKSIDSFIKNNPYGNFEIIIIDNNSPKPLPGSILNNSKIIKIYNKRNIGFGRAHNQASKIARGRTIILQNPDTVFINFKLEKVENILKKNKNVGLIGPKIVDESGNILKTYGNLPLIFNYISEFIIKNKIRIFINKIFKKKKYPVRNKSFYTDVIGGACIIIRADLFRKINGFDENYFMYFEEADLCIRVKENNYKILYEPSLKIKHLQGRSSSNKEKLSTVFDKSRKYFFEKHQGRKKTYMAELFINNFNKTTIFLILILALSLFLNLYKINTLIMFIGDIGTDYLSAYRMIVNKEIPLVGITSSVTWLHQGPLSVYLIAVSLGVSKLNPIAPAVLYSVLGSVTTFFVYKLSSKLHSKNAGLISALFFATSSLIIVNARSAYHTSPIPFFVGLFLLFFYKYISSKNIKYYYFSWFLLGLIMQLELSNASFILFIFVFSFFFLKDLKAKNYLLGFGFFVIGIIPFVIYDIFNGYKQTLGFILWSLNRIRLFIGIAPGDKKTIYNLYETFYFNTDQFQRLIFTPSGYVVLVFLFLAIFGIFIWYKNLKSKINFYFIIIPFVLSILSFIIHSKPGPAYYPLIFLPFSVIFGIGIYEFCKRHRILIVLFVALCIFNSYYILSNNFYLDTYDKLNSLSRGWNYGLGIPLQYYLNYTEIIVKDSGGKPIKIIGEGFLAKNERWVDNYRYLLLFKGANLSSNPTIIYKIYSTGEKDLIRGGILYEDKFITIEKEIIR